MRLKYYLYHILHMHIHIDWILYVDFYFLEFYMFTSSEYWSFLFIVSCMYTFVILISQMHYSILTLFHTVICMIYKTFSKLYIFDHRFGKSVRCAKLRMAFTVLGWLQEPIMAWPTSQARPFSLRVSVVTRCCENGK